MYRAVLCLLAFAIQDAHLALAGSLQRNDRGNLFFSGNIEPGDEKRLSALVHQVPYAQILLRSNGGDVKTAIAMGQILRSNNKTAVVPLKSYCRSACVFLLAGAVDRSIFGEVAIHRPYYTQLSPDQPAAQVQRDYNQFRAEIVSYFHEMNVPVSLADAMFAVRPESRRVLTKAELTEFMLNQSDPVYDEMLTASMASVYRLNSAEYRRRESLSWSKCNYIVENPPRGFDHMYEDHEACRLSVIANLPLKVAQERWRTYQQLYDSEIEDFDPYACMRAVYLDGATKCPRLQ